MVEKTNRKFKTYLILSIIFTAILLISALMIGRYKINISSFINALKGNRDFDLELNIIMKLRLPRTLLALLVGIGLSVSGLVYQEIFQNRLVSPDILGVSSGASVGVALGLLIGLPLLTISLVGFVFGILSMILTLLIARTFKNKNETILIMAGVIISGFMTSILSIIKTIANTDTVLPNITYWLLGSFEKTVIKDVFMVAPIIIIGTVVLLIMRWKVNVISLGYEEATTKGINYKRYRVVIIVVATLITAAAVAFAGVIGWVGLVIPHIVRLVIGRNTKYTIPLSVTFGGAFMVLSDILSRSIFQAEIPLSAVTGFVGVPIFIIILVLSSNEVNKYD